MDNNSENDKTCPILAASVGGGSNTSTGAYWASRCKRDGCGWWNDKHNCCSVIAISEILGEVLAAGLPTIAR